MANRFKEEVRPKAHPIVKISQMEADMMEKSIEFAVHAMEDNHSMQVSVQVAFCLVGLEARWCMRPLERGHEFSPYRPNIS